MTIPWQPPWFGIGLEENAAWNGLVALAGQELPLHERGGTLSFSLVGAPPPDTHLVRLESDFAERCALHVVEFPFATLFEVDLAVEDLRSLPPALAESIHEGMAEHIATLSGIDPSLVPIRTQGPLSAFPDLAGSDVQWFALSLTGQDGVRVSAIVASDRPAVLRLAEGLSGDGMPLAAAVRKQIRVPADVTIGCLEIPISEISELRPGAIAVMRDGAAALCIRVDETIYEFDAAEGGWACDRRRERNEAAAGRDTKGNEMGATMQDETDAAGEEKEPTAGPPRLPELRVAIDFDLDRRMVTVGELATWVPGATVPLEIKAPEEGMAVTIRANGDVVGSGDVVRIDDRLAVRITRFLGTGGTQDVAGS